MFRLSASVVTVFMCASMCAAESSPNEQLPAGTMQEKAASACLSCHEARIIVQQRLSKAAWTREVDKMMKWGATVEAADHDALIDYFSANFSAEQPAYAAPTTSREAASKVRGRAKK